METKDIKVGDKVQIRGSIRCTVMEITSNGWVKCCWLFRDVNNKFGLSFPEMQINSFRASQIDKIIEEI